MRGITRYHRHETEPGAYGLLAGLIVLALAAAALTFGGCAHHKSKGDQVAAVNWRYDAAVKVTAACTMPDGTRTGGTGSGVIIDDTRILTAGHVAETDGASCVFTLEDANGKRYLAYPKAVLSSDTVDLAVMQLASPIAKFPAARRARFGKVPRLGDIVCSATAYPRREYKCGPVMKSREQPGDIRINLVVEPGNSGSALYNARGEIVGIVVHTYPNRGNGQYITGGATSLAGHLKELGL